MKHQVEEIIKKHISCHTGYTWIGEKGEEKKDNHYRIYESSISIIADEVLKSMKKLLDENLCSNHDKCPNKMTCIGYQNCVSDIDNLLSNLSPNKENK